MCFIFDAGNFFSCVCNLIHPDCINNSCMTDVECARQIEKDLTNNVVIRDDQFCYYDVPSAAVGCRIIYESKSYISFRYCCRGTNCSSNDTAIDEFLRTHLNSECLHIYVFVCVCVFTCITDVFVCMCRYNICVCVCYV